MQYDIRMWHQIILEERAKLIVSDEKRKWILETYPPDETGRPGFFSVKEERSSAGKNVVGYIPYSWEQEGSKRANEVRNSD